MKKYFLKIWFAVPHMMILILKNYGHLSFLFMKAIHFMIIHDIYFLTRSKFQDYFKTERIWTVAKLNTFFWQKKISLCLDREDLCCLYAQWSSSMKKIRRGGEVREHEHKFVHMYTVFVCWIVLLGDEICDVTGIFWIFKWLYGFLSFGNDLYSLKFWF